MYLHAELAAVVRPVSARVVTAVGHRLTVHDHLLRRRSEREANHNLTLSHHARELSLRGLHDELQPVALALVRDPRFGKHTALVVVRVPFVLVKDGGTGVARHNQQDQRVQLHVERLAQGWFHRQDGPGPGVQGDFVQREGPRHGSVTGQKRARSPLVPRTRRQPHLLQNEEAVLADRPRHRVYQQVVAEVVLVLESVGFFALRVFVVEGMTNGHAGFVRLARLTVDVGNQSVSQEHRFAHGVVVLDRVSPETPLDLRALGGVRAENRTEGAELNPARVQLRWTVAPHVAADVVAPVAEPHVRRRHGEVGLKIQRLPRDLSVAAEADLVAVVAETAVAVHDDRPRLALPLHVREENVVQVERGVHPGNARGVPLLPVQPPEVHAHLLQRVQNEAHVVLGELLVHDVKRNVAFGGRVDSHGSRHFRVHGFVRLDARRRVQVQANLQAFLLGPVQKVLRVGEVVAIPRVAGPAGRLPGLVAHQAAVLEPLRQETDVPVDVDHEHVQRHLVSRVLVDELAELRVGVLPVARPPDAEGKARRHRDPAGDQDEILQSLLVVVAVAEEVPVLLLPLRPGLHPGPVRVVENGPFGVVNQNPAVAGDQSLTQVDLLARPDSAVAVVAVQGPGGAVEVASVGHSRLPGLPAAIHQEIDSEVVGGKRTAVQPVSKVEIGRLDPQPAVLFAHRVRRHWNPPVHEHQRGVVLECSVPGPLHSDDSRCEYGETRLLSHHHRLRVGYRVVLSRHGCSRQESERTHGHQQRLPAHFALLRFARRQRPGMKLRIPPKIEHLRPLCARVGNLPGLPGTLGYRPGQGTASPVSSSPGVCGTGPQRRRPQSPLRWRSAARTRKCPAGCNRSGARP